MCKPNYKKIKGCTYRVNLEGYLDNATFPYNIFAVWVNQGRLDSYIILFFVKYAIKYSFYSITLIRYISNVCTRKVLS